MPSLPIFSVEEIFARMSVVYGSAWTSLWIGVNADDVKHEWATSLGFLAHRLDAIHYALDHLPVDRPPNVLQFRLVCLSAPESARAPQLPDMPPKKVDIARYRAAFTRLKELRADLKNKPRQWAYDLQERERRGETLSEGQRLAWREALRTVNLPPEAAGGTMNLVPVDCLPPAMRAELEQR